MQNLKILDLQKIKNTVAKNLTLLKQIITIFIYAMHKTIIFSFYCPLLFSLRRVSRPQSGLHLEKNLAGIKKRENKS